MKKQLLYFMLPLSVLLACNKEEEIKPDFDYMIPEVIEKVDVIDDLIESGEYAKMTEYFSAPEDYEFLNGSTNAYEDNTSTFKITNLRKNNSSDPAEGKIVLDGTAEYSTKANPQNKYLGDFKFILGSTGNVAEIKNWKIKDIQQSNWRVSNLEKKISGN